MRHAPLLAIVLFLFGAGQARAAVLYVDGGHCPSGNGQTWGDAYCTISEAVAAASPGDSIYVKAGL